jgi:hypothetical protein
MGNNGSVKVRLETKFDSALNSASRTVTYLDGDGLNSLASSQMSNEELWEINRDIIADTIELPDGDYTIALESTALTLTGNSWVLVSVD